MKLCGNSHSGSFKDLGMTVLVSVVRQAIQEGLKVKAIACASTGDTSASLAAFGAAAGLPVVVLLPRNKVSTAQLVQPVAHGALVLGLDTDFDGCMEIVQQLAAEGHGLSRQLDEPAASRRPENRGHRRSCSSSIGKFRIGSFCRAAIWATLRRDVRGFQDDARARHHFALPAASSWRRRRTRTRCTARGRPASVSSRRCTAKPTQATAIQIGNPVSAPRAMVALEEMNGIVEQASEQELC